MTARTTADPITTSLADKVRHLRKRRGLTSEQLAEAMTDHGIPWSRLVVTKLENYKRRSVSLAEWLALACALEVPPLTLLPEGAATVPTEPAAPRPCTRCHALIDPASASAHANWHARNGGELPA